MEKAFILYDLEATCWRTSRPKRVEIIEVGAVKSTQTLKSCPNSAPLSGP